MTFSLLNIIQKHIINLKPYSSARDEYTGKEGVFLDANENSFGSTTTQNYNRYPDPKQWEVKQKIAQIKQCKPEQIFLGNGSDEAIDLLIRACCEPKKDNIIIMPPTYGMYQVCADIQQIEAIKVLLTPEFELDVESVLKSITPNTKIIWICSPNNPSGNLLNIDFIIEILKKAPCLVAVDEAYIDFTEQQSFIQLLGKYPNLVVLQTFSKAWGLAGLRLGMAFASPELIGVLNKIKYPYNINLATQKLLLEALDKEDKKDKYVKKILNERFRLFKALLPLNMVQHVYPSDSNSLLVKIKDAKKVFDYLIEQKIIVRDRSSVILCEDCLRITIGTRAENKKLIDTLAQYVA